MIPLAGFLQPLRNLTTAPLSNGTNIIILVFDAWSARHLPIYGYPRQTMPHVEAFAENALVYHNHNSAGTFTIPGTASILTGLYPWSHRAFQIFGTVIRAHSSHHIFSTLRGSDSTLAYTQNKWADLIVDQARGDLDTYIKSGEFDLQKPVYESSLFKNDLYAAFSGYNVDVIQSGSLFLAPLLHLFQGHQRLKEESTHQNTYPDGLPDSINGLFTLKDVVDGAIQTLGQIKQPTLAYLHFYPPHDPYAPTIEFLKAFKRDGYLVPRKPYHPVLPHIDHSDPDKYTLLYDQYLASWDAEVSRLFDFLASSGLTRNSHIFLTSDHGETFERGDIGHFTRLIFDPLIHVPLMVSTPGQKGRQDIYTRTSNIDFLPTLAHLTNNPMPDWAEGYVLPGLGGVGDADRSIFVLDAKQNSSFEPLTQYSASLTKGDYRLTHYVYPSIERYELYNLAEDPEELNDIYSKSGNLANQMQAELQDKLSAADQPYRK
jgi:arylsulfatase A-like enzyme